jgi:hypothetical protein
VTALAHSVARIRSERAGCTATNRSEGIVMPPVKKAAPAAKKAAAPPKAAAPAQATVTLKHLAAELADSHDLPKK